MEISSKVSRGPHKGETQKPWKNQRGEYALSAYPKNATEKGHHDAHYILVKDLQSVANGLRAGLRLRMESENVDDSMRKASEVKINGGLAADYDPPKRSR